MNIMHFILYTSDTPALCKNLFEYFVLLDKFLVECEYFECAGIHIESWTWSEVVPVEICLIR